MISTIRNAIMLSSALALAMPGVVQAQYVGPASQKSALTVAEILKNPVDDQAVVLRGH